ncbi:hypothetical protein DMN91_006291 [Ooceraea biroi]|uniref:HTH CENPB-type domain-containing protein n=1 Tax=Ooceraea biroi TaxID=2015173 RepID=A0A3L8DNW0_OOCBI|nr:protein PDC2-like [Ooceraea biroi]RLU21912.1 hypothetical protein DMN91_006291 [Ooceraea biroi]
MKAIRNDLLRWTCERHAGDHPLDRRLLRDKALELAGEHGLTGFKCSESWLTCFLKRYSFLVDLDNHSGPIFSNYRVWIDTMRSVITQYKHKDLFHLDELTMYSDISPARVSSTLENDELDPTLKKATVLMCCNSSGTEKLPLLICGSYPAVIVNESYVYSHSEDASINDTLFKEWVNHVNDRMLESNRKILLLLHRDRVNAFRGLGLSNVRHVFFPDAFPPLLRPLKRDVFHFVKMIYRSKYVEGIKEHEHRWNAENVVKSLVEAWRKVPRNLIIASFQRTSFRTDDCFLEIHCDAWEDLKIGTSFKKFVTFDDKLSTNASYKQRKSTGKTHEYNLRTRQIVTVIDEHFDTIHSKENERIDDHTQVNGNLKEIYMRKNIDWKRKGSLKRSYEKAQLSEDGYEEMNNVKSSDNSTSKNNEDIVTVPPPAKLPKINDIHATENASQGSKSEEIYSTRTIVNATLTTSGRNASCDCELDKTVNNEKRNKNNQTCSSKRSIESSSEVDITSDSDIALQQVYDTSPVDTQKETNAMISYSPGEETELTDLNKSGRLSRKSLKRRRSRSDNTEESRNNSDNDEPERKRLSSDSDWAKQFETTFVFGSSDFARSLPTAFADALTMSDDGAQRPRLRRSCETERSIFTICPRRD